jgi:hypothetical protein
VDEASSYAVLAGRRHEISSKIAAAQLALQRLREELHAVDRKQDEWLAVFGLRHGVRVSVRHLCVDIEARIAVLSDDVGMR